MDKGIVCVYKHSHKNCPYKRTNTTDMFLKPFSDNINHFSNEDMGEKNKIWYRLITFQSQTKRTS